MTERGPKRRKNRHETPEAVLQRAINKIAEEMDNLETKDELTGSEARALTDYTKALVTVIREQRMAAELQDLEELAGKELEQLTKEAEKILKATKPK